MQNAIINETIETHPYRTEIERMLTEAELDKKKSFEAQNIKLEVLSWFRSFPAEHLVNVPYNEIQTLRSFYPEEGGPILRDEILVWYNSEKTVIMTQDKLCIECDFEKIEILDGDYLCGIKDGKEYYVTPTGYIPTDDDPPVDAITFVDRYDYDPSL